MTFSSSDLEELDKIWPIGRELVVPDDGVIFVAGAWRGRYCRYLAERFPNAWVYGFEPQRKESRATAFGTHGYANIEIFPFGIGLKGGVGPMGEAGTDGCSLLRKNSGQTTQGMFIESHAIRCWLGAERVSLAVINMEGFEYPLLADWLKHGQIQFYDSLAIQFHPDVANVAPGMPLNAPQFDSLFLSLIDHYGQPKSENYPTWCYWRK